MSSATVEYEMDDHCDVESLCKICELMGSEFIGERAAAAERSTELLSEHGLTWRDYLAGKPIPNPKEAAPHAHKYNGFIPFAESTQSTYDEARGYAILMATRDEQRLLRK